MWTTIARFELRYQLRQPLFATSALIFFAIGLGLASSNLGDGIGESPGSMIRNAPILTARLMPVLSLLGLFVITAFVASAGLRDFDRRSDMLFFTKPLRKLDYLGGRFAGSMVVSFLVLFIGVLGLVAGYFAPWQPADRTGPFRLDAYAFGLVVIIIPNLLTMGALFFALSIWLRRLSVSFLCAVFFMGMQDAVEVLAHNLESSVVGSLLEPSGLVALETAARYWTMAEQGTRLPALGGVLLANRVLWMVFAFVVLAIGVARFDFTASRRASKSASKRASRGNKTAPSLPVHASSSVDLPSASTRLATWMDHARDLARQTRIEVSQVLLGAPFLSLLALGLMFVVAHGLNVGTFDGMPSQPLTRLMLDAIYLGVRVGLVMILVFYAGELVFGARELELSQVYDALPVPNAVLLGAKVLALVSTAGVFLALATAATVGIQLAKGYTRLEPSLYARGIMVLGVPLVLVIILAIALQVLANHKLTGLLLTGLVLLARLALPRLGIDSNLVLYAKHPAMRASAFEGYGHQTESFVWFMTYWGAGALILAMIALLFWPRGTETSARGRLALARKRLNGPIVGALALGAFSMVTLGGWIHHTSDSRVDDREGIMARLADYERAYSQYTDLPLPRITSVFAEVDLYPSDRRVAIRGRYQLENQSGEPIRLLPITCSPRWVEGVLRVYGGVTFDRLDLPPHTTVVDDDTLGFYLFELDQPLEPGDALELSFAVSVDQEPFMNRRHNDLVIENGTFFTNREFFPFVGYAGGNQLIDPIARAKHELPPVTRAASRDDVSAHGRNYIGADWARFEAIVSTELDQLAITTGDVVREWMDGDRRYVHYKTADPVVNLLPFLSGRYAVTRDRWQDVEIEVFHHPDHTTNIDRFVEITKQSLAYMTAHVGPYTHNALRIIEIPSHHGQIAFAFPQTIAYSEFWGYSADLDHAELDWLAGVLAHEVAHQWWNYQMVPADVQGATMLGESLAQYSAMMILEEAYGAETVHRFLAFHLDRYLERRGNERIGERPLALVENQAYIHYSKGSLAFYALKDWVGEASVNEALRAFRDEAAFRGPPYATSRDLLAHLRRVVPTDSAHVVEDLFETVTLFDLRVDDASYVEQLDGTYLVTIDTTSTKLRADDQGVFTEIAIDDRVDIGVFGEPSKSGRMTESTLVLEKHRLRSKDGRFTFVVNERPVRVGIDPYNKLVDRDAGDNVRTVSQQ